MADPIQYSSGPQGLENANKLRRKPVPMRNTETESMESIGAQSMYSNEPAMPKDKQPKSLLDLPNEILYEIIDATVASALSSPEDYDVSGHKFEKNDPKAFSEFSLRLYNIDASYLDPVTGKRDFAARHRREQLYMRPRNYDYHWKQLWLDLGIARANCFFRGTTWPRVDIIIADSAKKFYKSKLLALPVSEREDTEFWREYHFKKLIQPCTTWSEIYEQYISVNMRLKRDDLWEIYRQRYQSMPGLDQWQWVTEYPAPEWEEESQAEMLARLREQRWNALWTGLKK